MEEEKTLTIIGIKYPTTGMGEKPFWILQEMHRILSGGRSCSTKEDMWLA